MQVVTDTLSNLTLTEQQEYRIIEEICDWERQAYGEDKHRTPVKFFECIKKNRTGFFISTHGGALVGYADVWQLRNDFYEGLKAGLIEEEALDSTAVLPETETGSNLWYIGSMIIEAEFRKKSPVAAAFTFAALSNSLPNFFREKSEFPAKVLGVGSSPFGQKLLNKWQCTAITEHRNAIDHRPRFEKSLNRLGDEDCFYITRRRH